MAPLESERDLGATSSRTDEAADLLYYDASDHTFRYNDLALTFDTTLFAR